MAIHYVSYVSTVKKECQCRVITISLVPGIIFHVSASYVAMYKTFLNVE